MRTFETMRRVRDFGNSAWQFGSVMRITRWRILSRSSANRNSVDRWPPSSWSMGAGAFALLCRAERPGGDVHLVGTLRVKRAHGDGGAVVNHEVREDHEIAVGVGDAARALFAQPRHEFLADRVNLGLRGLAVE